MNKSDFIKEINSLRKANKNKWFYWQGVVEGKSIALKCYNTWLQIYRVGTVNYSGLMDISVKDYTLTLEKPFT